MKLLMVCRAVNDAGEGIKPGCVGGYFCECCKQELQLSPDGQKQLAAGTQMTMLCNRCGFKIAGNAAKENRLVSVIFNPAAAEQIRKRGNR